MLNEKIPCGLTRHIIHRRSPKISFITNGRKIASLAITMSSWQSGKPLAVDGAFIRA
jgi:hypothetical protein